MASRIERGVSVYGAGRFDSSTLDGPQQAPHKQRLVFFGNERIATGVSSETPVLRSLIESGYDIAAVVSNYERGSSRNVRELEIAEVAKEHGIPLLLPNKLKDIAAELKNYGALAAVLVAYGKIIPQSIIDIFPRGIINLHPSLLPKHRGPTPLESVLLDGSTVTGVSIMALAQEMDAGPIYGQAEYELTGGETKQELAEDLLELGAAMLEEILPEILSGDVVAAPQDHALATYDKLITKADGLLDWTKPAVQLEREIRAYAEWPKSWTTLAGKEIVITKAHVLESKIENRKSKIGEGYVDGKELHIQTSDGVLVVDSLKAAGKAEMPAAAFLAGYRKDL